MLRVAVAGVGHLGQFHAEKFTSIDNVKLTGVYDIDTARARQIAGKLGVKRFKSYEALLEEVDAVDIASTTTAHYELAKQLLSLRKKGVLIIGSGNMVHNLRMVAWDKLQEPEYGFDWAVEMNVIFKEKIRIFSMLYIN